MRPHHTAAAESELDQASRKRVVSFYEPSLPPELPVPEAAYSTPQLKQQLEKLKVSLAHASHHSVMASHRNIAAAGMPHCTAADASLTCCLGWLCLLPYSSTHPVTRHRCCCSGGMDVLLQELLVSRPAWPLELLLHNIPSSTADSLHVALHALCYQFKTGMQQQANRAEMTQQY